MGWIVGAIMSRRRRTGLQPVTIKLSHTGINPEDHADLRTKANAILGRLIVTHAIGCSSGYLYVSTVRD